MARWYAMFTTVVLVSACGHSPLPALQTSVPLALPVAATAIESVTGDVRASVDRFLVKHHPGMVRESLTVARTVQNGVQLFEATGKSPRQLRRLNGHYDVTTRVATVDTDVVL